MTTPAKFDQYIKLCLDHELIRGKDTIIQLVAIGAAESGLDNMAVGRNDLNGTPVTSDFYESLGLGWLQHDSGWLMRESIVNGLKWSIEVIRSDPDFSLDLIGARGFIKFQGVDTTYIDFGKWATWPKKSDAFVAAATESYNRVTS